MKILFKSVARQCGPCTACCKVMSIPELDKPNDVWCRHAAKGAGCRIYADRPQSCRDFACLWLQGLAPEWARPDKVHAVLRMTSDGEHLVLHEDTGWRGHARLRLKEFVDNFTEDGKHYVIIGCGEERTLVGSVALVAEALEKGKL